MSSVYVLTACLVDPWRTDAHTCVPGVPCVRQDLNAAWWQTDPTPTVAATDGPLVTLPEVADEYGTTPGMAAHILRWVTPARPASRSGRPAGYAPSAVRAAFTEHAARPALKGATA